MNAAFQRLRALQRCALGDQMLRGILAGARLDAIDVTAGAEQKQRLRRLKQNEAVTSAERLDWLSAIGEFRAKPDGRTAVDAPAASAD